MLSEFVQNLENSIKWAQFDEGIEVLMLARDNMEKLVDYVATFDPLQQDKVLSDIDKLLPMEWAFWMEVCRSEDVGLFNEAKVLH